MSAEPFDQVTTLLADNPAQWEIEKSKTLATLALAHEQRTANLIAYLAISGNSETAAIPVPVNVLRAVQADVEERLGLA